MNARLLTLAMVWMLMGRLCGTWCVSYAALSSNQSASPRPANDAVAQQTLRWLRSTVREPYDLVGKKDPRWDTSARKALDEYVLALAPTADPDGSRLKIVGAAAHEALEAGCNDPLITYLDIRFGDRALAAFPAKQADALRRVADRIMNSDYPAIRKYFVCVRASGNLARNPPNQRKSPEADLLLRRKAVHYLAEAMKDKTMPIEQVLDAWDQIQKRLRYDTDEVPGRLEECYREIEQPLFENWPKEATSYLIKGNFYVEHAWTARTSATADLVTEQGWKLFGERLAVSAEALETAWKMNPKDARIAMSMMAVETGQGQGRDRMELWFDRAMKLDPNSYQACKVKTYYLEPKWHGSPEALLAFGRECVQSTNWGGAVPMVMVDVHEALAKYLPRSQATNYWTQPSVWPDFQAAYEKYLRLNPKAIAGRVMYARYAAKCGQWEEFDKIIERFAPLPEDQALDTVRFNRFLDKKDYAAACKLAAHLGDTYKDDPQLQNMLSWRLVAVPGLTNPNLDLAEKLALRAIAIENAPNPYFLGTLARVRFMQDKRTEAISLEEKAVAVAKGQIKATLERDLEAYRKGELPPAD